MPIDAESYLAKTRIQLLIEPFLPLNNFYAAYILWLVGNFEDAVLQGRKTINMQPDFWSSYFHEGFMVVKKIVQNQILIGTDKDSQKVWKVPTKRRSTAKPKWRVQPKL